MKLSLYYPALILILASLAGSAYAGQEHKNYQDQDIKALMDETLVLSPEEIQSIRRDMKKYNADMQKIEIPKNHRRVIVIDPDDYRSAPVVKVVANFPSSLAFFDITGQPWNLAEIMQGNSKIIQVRQSEKAGNIVWVVPQTVGGSTSIAVLMEGMHKTFTIMIEASTTTMSRDTIIRVSAMSAASKATTFVGRTKEPAHGDELFLLKFFSSAIPVDKSLVREINVGSMGVRVWIARKSPKDAWNMIVKSKHRLLTPYDFSVMNEVYLIEKPKPFLRFIVSGSSVRLSTGL